jgi:WD40 repeat protein
MTFALATVLLAPWTSTAAAQTAEALPGTPAPQYPDASYRHPPRFQLPAGHLKDPGGCRFLSFSPDGRQLASTNGRDEVTVFDAATGAPLWGWSYPELLRTSLGDLVWPFCPRAKDAWEKARWRLTAVPGRPKGWPGDTGAVFAPDGSELAVVHDPCLSNSHVIVEAQGSLCINPGVWLLGGYLHFFHRPDMGLRLTVEVDTPQHLPLTVSILHGLAGVSAFDYAPAGGLAATGLSDGRLKLWNTDTGASVAQTRAEWLPDNQPSINFLAFGPDGTRVATIGQSGVVRVWSVPGLRQQAELVGHTQSGFWVGFSPDGARVASAASDGALRIWNPVTRVTLRQENWRKHLGDDPFFAYLPAGGAVLYAATRETGVIGMVADVPSRPDSAWSVDLPNITAFTCSRRGDLLAAGDRDGRVLVWRVAWGPYAAR